MIDVESLDQHPGCNPACQACHYKNVKYQSQLKLKNDWARKNLEKWLRLLEPIEPAPVAEQLGYRKKAWLRASVSVDPIHMPLQFGMVRSIRQPGIKGKKAWKKEFVHWDHCPIHSDFIKKTMVLLSRLLSDQDLSDFVGMWVSEPNVVLVFRRQPDLIAFDFDMANLWIHINPQAGNRAFGTGPIIPVSTHRKQDHPPSLDSPIKAFRQIANTLLKRARALAVDHMMSRKPDCILDLYSGAGQMAELLPRQTSWIGIEQSRDAVEFSKALRHTDLPTFHMAFTGSVEQRLRDPVIIKQGLEKANTYALYLNPPRSGLSDEAVLAIAELFKIKRPVSISYLSCSASSLSRNLVQFEDLGFKVKSLKSFDFFPHTEHFETLANLLPASD